MTLFYEEISRIYLGDLKKLHAKDSGDHLMSHSDVSFNVESDFFDFVTLQLQ